MNAERVQFAPTINNAHNA
jgi:DNA replicative helicase MCM subunit Mcm2 (Cdc46/Mcm family)